MKSAEEIDFKAIPRLGKNEKYVVVEYWKSDYRRDDGTLPPNQTKVSEYSNKKDLREGLTEYIPSHCGWKYEIYIARKVVS